MALFDVTNVVFLNFDNLHFPWDVPFEVKDQYNGPALGTWYLHSWNHQSLYGPFETEEETADWLAEIEEYEE